MPIELPGYNPFIETVLNQTRISDALKLSENVFKEIAEQLCRKDEAPSEEMVKGAIDCFRSAGDAMKSWADFNRALTSQFNRMAELATAALESGILPSIE